MLERIKERGGGLVVVCPGGYNTPYSQQRAFYEKCGFRQTEPGKMEIRV